MNSKNQIARAIFSYSKKLYSWKVETNDSRFITGIAWARASDEVLQKLDEMFSYIKSFSIKLIDCTEDFTTLNEYDTI